MSTKSIRRKFRLAKEQMQIMRLAKLLALIDQQYSELEKRMTKIEEQLSPKEATPDEAA